MIPQYSDKRRCYICYVNKAQKDNKIVKKGESYIWVKKSEFSPKEYFKNEEELSKVYQSFYNIKYDYLVKILLNFKEELKINPKISPKKYLENFKITK